MRRRLLRVFLSFSSWSLNFYFFFMHPCKPSCLPGRPSFKCKPTSDFVCCWVCLWRVMASRWDAGLTWDWTSQISSGPGWRDETAVQGPSAQVCVQKTTWHEAGETRLPMGTFKKKKKKKRAERNEKEKYDLFSMFTVYFFLESRWIFQTKKNRYEIPNVLTLRLLWVSHVGAYHLWKKQTSFTFMIKFKLLRFFRI